MSQPFDLPPEEPVYDPSQDDELYTHIRSLDLSGNGMENGGLQYLCDFIASRPVLHSLSISRSRLGYEGCVSLASALLCDQMDFSYVFEYYFASDYDRFRMQAPKLQYPERVSAALTDIDLATCGVEDKGFVALCFAFAQLPSLRTVKLSDNFVGQLGGDVGIPILESSQTLLTVSLHGNSISHTSLRRLARQLAKNRQRVAMSAPMRFQQKISALQRDTQSLPVAQEELEFAKQSLELLATYTRTVERQAEELAENFDRQEASIKTREAQAEDASRQAQEGIEQAAQRFEDTKQNYQQQIEAAGVALKADEEQEAALEESCAEAQRATQDLDAWAKQQLEELSAQIDDYRRKKEEQDALDARISSCLEFLDRTQKDVLAKMQASSSTQRIAFQMSFEDMATVVDRMEVLVGGGHTIPQPVGYDPRQVVAPNTPRTGRKPSGSTTARAPVSPGPKAAAKTTTSRPTSKKPAAKKGKK